MKKYFKTLLLAMCCIALGGWGDRWGDIRNDYSDIVDSEIYCTYTDYTEELKEIGLFKKMKIGTHSDSIYAIYDDGDETVILNSDNYSNNLHYFGGLMFAYNDYKPESFLASYKESGACPSTLYVCLVSTAGGYFLRNYSDPNSYCVSLRNTDGGDNQGQSPDIVEPEDPEDPDDSDNPDDTDNPTEPFDPSTSSCYLPTSESCKRYTYVDENLFGSDTIYIELGKKRVNSSLQNYFVVSRDNFVSGAIGDESNDFLTTGSIDKIYTIANENIFDNYPDVIKITFTVIGYTTYYYIGNTAGGNNPEDVPGDFEGGYGYSDGTGPGDLGGSTDQTQEIKSIVFCEKPGVLQSFKIVGYILFIAKIAIPLILIIMASVDLARAVISSDDKANKVALSALIRRIALGVIIFFIPALLDFVFSLIDDAANTTSKFSNCTTCLFNPGDCADGYLEQINDGIYSEGNPPSALNPDGSHNQPPSTSTVPTGNYIWPVGSATALADGTYMGPPVSVNITSYFGHRAEPVPGATTDHGAIDIGVARETPVIASDAGKVIKVASGCSEGDFSRCVGGSYGNYVQISHSNGVSTLYAHLKSIVVSEGQEVRQGELIAYSGNTGRTSGPHLHFEVRENNVRVDPLNYVSPTNPR